MKLEPGSREESAPLLTSINAGPALAGQVDGSGKAPPAGVRELLGLFRTISLVVITLLVMVFLIQNLATAEVAFLTWSISAPRSVIFALIFALGWAAGFLVHAFSPRSPAKRRAPDEGGDAPSDM